MAFSLVTSAVREINDRMVEVMTLAVLLAYTLGGLTGYLLARSGRFTSKWRLFIRAQLLLSSGLIALLAGWDLQGWSDVVWPLIVTGASILLIGIAYLLTSPSPSRSAYAVLRGWSTIPNPAFWLVPMSAAIAGINGAIIAVFIDQIARATFGVFVWILRRHAPIPQKKRTSFIDQAPFIALVLGLILNFFSDAPEWTNNVLDLAAPVLAITGAAVFMGSVLQPSQRIPWRSGVRIWVILTVVRIVVLLALLPFAPSPAIAVVLVLGACSIPAFLPPQYSVLYGYADPVVATSVRLGWFLAPIGLVAAVLIMR